MTESTTTISTVDGLDPDGFDLDAWIDGVKPLRQSVTIYARGDLMPRIDELVAEMQRIKDDDDGSGELTLAEKPRRLELRDELAQLWHKYEASGVEFVLEQVSQDTVAAITELVDKHWPGLPALADNADDETRQTYEAQARLVEEKRADMFGLEMAARSIVTYARFGATDFPERASVTPAQLLRMRARFGALQFSELLAAAQTLAFQGQVSVPFSRRVSEVLGENTSS